MNLRLSLDVITIGLMVVVFLVQMHLLLNVIPEEKALMEECNFAMLCEKGLINPSLNPECEIYRNIYIIPNFTTENLTVGTTIY